MASEFTGFSLVCSTTKTKFESLFGVKLSAAKAGQKPLVPAELSAWVDHVTLPEPPLQF